MTKKEFVEDVVDFEHLIEFCSQNRCDITDGIFVYTEMSNIIEDDLQRYINYHSWTEIRDYLVCIPDDGSFYIYDEYGNWISLSEYSDFDEYKQDALEWGDRMGIWEEDEVDEKELDFSDDATESESVEFDKSSTSDLIDMWTASLHKI